MFNSLHRWFERPHSEKKTTTNSNIPIAISKKVEFILNLSGNTISVYVINKLLDDLSIGK
jgi:hypothetical protein